MLVNPPRSRRMLSLDAPPYSLSGAIYGVLMNDPAALQALGEAAAQPPYKAPPRAPVLYMKPRNTFAQDGARMAPPAGVPALELGATVGLVIGRAASRVPAARALDHVAGVVLVADLFVPHQSFYRPSVRLRALDGSCFVSSRLAPVASLQALSSLTLQVDIDGAPAAALSLAGMQRPADVLLQDVSEFMTLGVGDVLLLGQKHGSPLLRPGQRFTISAPGLGALSGELGAAANGASR
ncbi:MAG: 2-hydroxyhepta-2,4-diene-1,7-dioate isomerase [Lautropia sp. SCN 66-9]|nr:MAG: 2-hydroxyhepta-2,4-diene-1,7-dioate isomerase [Lautropia sp. SCN 66-9]